MREEEKTNEMNKSRQRQKSRLRPSVHRQIVISSDVGLFNPNNKRIVQSKIATTWLQPIPNLFGNNFFKKIPSKYYWRGDMIKSNGLFI